MKGFMEPAVEEKNLIWNTAVVDTNKSVTQACRTTRLRQSKNGKEL